MSKLNNAELPAPPGVDQFHWDFFANLLPTETELISANGMLRLMLFLRSREVHVDDPEPEGYKAFAGRWTHDRPGIERLRANQRYSLRTGTGL
jgi:hypothetical protein